MVTQVDAIFRLDRPLSFIQSKVNVAFNGGTTGLLCVHLPIFASSSLHTRCIQANIVLCYPDEAAVFSWRRSAISILRLDSILLMQLKVFWAKDGMAINVRL
jgi:hypothetical protein